MGVSEAFKVARGGFTTLAGGVDSTARALIAQLRRDLGAHVSGAANPHPASQIEFTPAGSIAATDVQAALVEVDGDVTAHVADATAAHAASAVSFTATGSISSTDVQAAVAELDGDVTAHVGDTADAHDASAISFTATGSISSTDVQAALEELDPDNATGVAACTMGTNIGGSKSVVRQPVDGGYLVTLAGSGGLTNNTGSALNTGEVVLTVPAGYRPAAAVAVHAENRSASVNAVPLTLNTDGTLVIQVTGDALIGSGHTFSVSETWFA